MKKRILSLIIALASLVAVIVCFGMVSSADDSATKTLPAGSGKVIDVWLVAGQSNAIGCAKLENYPTDEAYAADKELLTNGSENVWHIKNTDTDFVPAGFKQGSGTQSGPEIGITTALDSSDNMNAIIKVAYGNTALYDNTSSTESIKYGTWTPPSYIDAHDINTQNNRTGDLYLTFIAKVAEGLEKLVAAGYTPNLKGVWFMQGEADTLVSSTTTARYEELLLTLISDMRSDLTEVSGTDCSDLPFVYGRIFSNHVNVGKDVPQSLGKVQAAQDNVANNKDLKNVFMINTSTDLVDPATGAHRLPVQQDGWHYDMLSQQMIGEKFVSIVNGVEGREGTLTKYGYVPANTSSAPFAIFKKVDGSYVFDTYQTTTETAINRAVALTHVTSGTTEEAVILMVKDYGAGNYGKNVANCGGTITLDLNGHTLAPTVALFTTVFSDSTAAKKTTFNVLNGKMVVQQFGLMFTTGSTAVSQSFDFNLENVTLGFYTGTESKTQENYKYRDLVISDRGCSTTNGAKVTVNVNMSGCTFDLVTNAQSNAIVGTLKENSGSNDNCYTDYNLVYDNCTFYAANADAVNCLKSKSGDTVTFTNGNDATYGNNSVYLLTKTAYGDIPADYTNIANNPFAIFKKIDGAYVFDSSAKDIKASIERAVVLTHAKTGVTDDVVILLRKDIAKDSTYPLNVADAAGTITLDLAGHNLAAVTALIRTDFDDDGVVDGAQKPLTFNVKNGSMELSMFGMIFTTVNSNYTVPKTFNFNIDNVKLSFYETTKNATQENYKYRDLLVSDRANSETTKIYINITATDCVFDLITNAQSNAILGTLECGAKDKDNNNYTVSIVGGTIITNNIANASCLVKGSGDKLIFKKDSEGNYTKFLMNQSLAEPSSTEKRIGDSGYEVSFFETRETVGVYKVYELRDGVVTKYGVIPESAAVSNFVVFVKNAGGEYVYNSAYTGWKAAFEGARNLTNGSATAYDEAMILMLKDSIEGSVPYHQDACGIINLDLNGKKLTVRGSFFNTYLVSSNSPTSTINVFGGTLISRQYGLIYTATKDATYETAGVEKTITLNFSNVELGLEARTDGKTNGFLTAYAYNGSTALNMTVNMNFDNCKLDLVNNATPETIIGRGKAAATTAMSNANTVDVNLAFTGCEFYVYSPSQIYMEMSAEGDSFVINKGADGKYATVITNSAKEETYFDIIAGNNGAEAVKLRTSFVGVEKGYAKYDLVETDGNITVPTAYAPIPQAYASTGTYPFALFYKDTNGEYVFSKGYATYKDAMNAAIELTKGSIASPYSEAVILLRTDVSAKGFPSYLSAIATTVTVDLNGYTLGALESLGNTSTCDTKDPSGKIVKTNGTINYKNGSILLHTHPGLYIAKPDGSVYTAGYQKTLNVNYENVYIGMAAGSVTPALLGRIASNHTTEISNVNITYKNCVIDMVTNRSTKSGFCIGNWVAGSDYTKVTVDFIGCEFIGLTEADFVHKVTSGQDIVRYSNTEGTHYATLTLPKDAAAPTGTYMIGNKTGSFVKASETETTITYVLRPTELVNVTYAPKMSLTLDRNLIMNVYIPVNSTLEFTFDGEKYTDFTTLTKNIVTLDDGNSYYRMTVELPAAVAAEDVKLTVKINTGSTTASGTFSFSIPKYAVKVLADTSATAVEKTLVRDVLLYVKAAYVYFETKNADTMAKINTVLGDYTAMPTIEGEYSTAFAGVNAVTFVLDGTPAMRFYLEDAAYAGDYKFYIDGKEVDVVVGEGDAYVDIDVYAYALSKTVTYTVNGKDGGSYHVRSYYEYVSGTGANSYNGTDKAELTSLVASFWNYLQSAEDYRQAVLK